MSEPRLTLSYLKSLPTVEKNRILSLFSEKELQILWYDWNFRARDKQLLPTGDWRICLILAGRGWGKTLTLTQWARKKANDIPGSIGALVGPTAADCRDVLVEGDSGLIAISPPWDKPVYSPTKRKITWKNGSYALMFSADEPDRLRGPQQHWAIADEIASWRYPVALDMLQMGLRLGEMPQVVVGTTPRPLPHIRGIVKMATEDDGVVRIVKGSTYENRDNLAASFFSYMIKRYEGTRLGQQELYAELLDDAKGALWKGEMFDRPGFRIDQGQSLPPLIRIVVGVDPGAKAPQELEQMMTMNEFGETGIVVAGLSRNGHIYVLDDYSLSAHPNIWATRVKVAYNHYKADLIVAERNNGGDMVEATIHTVAPGISYKDVTATRGKAVRAEPVASLYEQGRVHHVGVLSELETQMTQWVPSDPHAKSPDRVDALCWAIHELAIMDEEEVMMRQAYVRD